jgi:hypothetical protein
LYILKLIKLRYNGAEQPSDNAFTLEQ